MRQNNKPEAGREPDNIIERELYGTKYTIHEYFDGKKTLEEIIAQRILQDEKRDIILPSISNPENG